jgi:hypothetical protein
MIAILILSISGWLLFRLLRPASMTAPSDSKAQMPSQEPIPYNKSMLASSNHDYSSQGSVVVRYEWMNNTARMMAHNNE